VVWSLFDIYAVAAGGTMGKLSLYTVQQGANYNFNGVTAFAKGEQHVSLVQPGQLESSYTFHRARALRLRAGSQGTAHPAVHREDLEKPAGLAGEVPHQQKRILHRHSGMAARGGGQVTLGFGSLTVPTASFTNTNGWQETDNVYALPGGQYINPQETFDCINRSIHQRARWRRHRRSHRAGRGRLPHWRTRRGTLARGSARMGQLIRVAQ